MTAAKAKSISIVQGKVRGLKDIQTLTDEQWVNVLQTQEQKSVQSTLEMCYAWHALFMACREVNKDTEVEEMNEVRFTDICDQVGISKATASKRVNIGANVEMLAPHLSILPSAIEPLVALCRIPDESLEACLANGVIKADMSREDAKYIKDCVTRAKSSSKYQGDIVGYLADFPQTTGGSLPEDKTPPKKETGGKKAKEQVKEQQSYPEKEAVAKSARLQKQDEAIDLIVNYVIDPEYFDSVIGFLNNLIEETAEPDVAKEAISDIEQAVTTIKLVSGGYDEV